MTVTAATVAVLASEVVGLAEAVVYVVLLYSVFVETCTVVSTVVVATAVVRWSVVVVTECALRFVKRDASQRNTRAG